MRGPRTGFGAPARSSHSTPASRRSSGENRIVAIEHRLHVVLLVPEAHR
jgi:hypothetical protein